jgi:hypothetical protein
MDHTNRRKAARISVKGKQEVVFGRNAGVLIDLSPRGARIRHSGSVRRGSSIRVSFARNGTRFSADAQILATRMVSLGTGLTYESRVHFPFIDHLSENVLRTTLDDIVGLDLRSNVANMLGSGDERQPKTAPRTDSYVRCRLQGTWWEKKITNDRTQPDNGFVLPAESTAAEIATLCATYAAGSEEDREMIRVMATAAVG